MFGDEPPIEASQFQHSEQDVIGENGLALAEGGISGCECPVCGILLPSSLVSKHLDAHFDGSNKVDNNLAAEEQQDDVRPLQSTGKDSSSTSPFGVPLDAASSSSKWCSWCLQKVEHRVLHQAPMQRAVCMCTKCERRTLACRLCQIGMAKGHETWDDELCAKCNRAIRDWGVAPQDLEHQRCQAWCSWCLENASHVLLQRNLMSRNVFKCSRCEGRTIPCVRCPDGMGRAAVGTTDLQCVKCCQSKTGKVFSTWESICRHVQNQVMVCRAHNMDLHSVLMAVSSHRRKAFSSGLIRPFLLLVTMDPLIRLNCAHLLGWSYSTSDFCGDPHAEAWEILTRKRQGLLARSRAFHEALSNKLYCWFHVLQRSLSTLAYSAEGVQDPGDRQALQWCQDPRFRMVEALERHLLQAIWQCKRGQGEKVETYDSLLAEVLRERTPANPTETSNAPETPAKACVPGLRPGACTSSEATPPPPHNRTISLLSNCSASSTSGLVAAPGHQRTASVLSNCSNLSTSGRTALLVPVVTMESPAGVQGQGLDELEPALALHPTPPACPSPGPAGATADGHGWPRSASENVEPCLAAVDDRGALHAFAERMADAGVAGPPDLSAALQVVLQLLDMYGTEGGVPPSLALLVSAVAQPAGRGDGSVALGPGSAGPLSMVRWVWRALDLHAVGSQAQGQVLAVVTHLLNQKLLLAAQGFAVEAYYGPDHPSCYGLPSTLGRTSSQGSVPETEESEGHFVGQADGGGEEASQEVAPAPVLKSLGAKFESRMKGLWRGSGTNGRR